MTSGGHMLTIGSNNQVSKEAFALLMLCGQVKWSFNLFTVCQDSFPRRICRQETFVREGVFRKSVIKMGLICDEVRYALIKEGY